MTNSQIIAHSITKHNVELITFEVTFPRIILPEVLTHRMFDRNTSSSRAIPFLTTLEVVNNNPFIPIAWQKDHKGMQGTEYFPKDKKFSLYEAIEIMVDTLEAMSDRTTIEAKNLSKRIDDLIAIINSNLLSEYEDRYMTLDNWWLAARDKAVQAATMLYVLGVTKQLTNRLLEPFMWTKMIITTGKEGLENFFDLRCPKYWVGNQKNFKSWKELSNKFKENGDDSIDKFSIIDRFLYNESQAEIHIQQLAELMYDSYMSSSPKMLNPGEYHLPYEDKMVMSILDQRELISFASSKNELKVKLSTAMIAHTSYTAIGDGKAKDFKRMLKLHDKLFEQKHMSPFGHIAKAMTDEEYYNFFKGDKRVEQFLGKEEKYLAQFGYCNNLRGFVQYRYMIENELNVK